MSKNESSLKFFVKRVARKITREVNLKCIAPLRVINKTKIFCIGRNKTGTTSLKSAFKDLGFIVGKQRRAELLLDEYISGNFEPIIKYCKSAQVFQDVPFSYPDTFKYLDKAFPGSKFILSVRDSPEQWYNSILKFHSKLYGKNGRLPTKDDLKNGFYIKKGRPWKSRKKVWNVPDEDPYNKKHLINNYLGYNQSVKKYFKERPANLIVVKVGKSSDYRRLMDFLNIDSPYNNFPWKNKTTNKKAK
jgi:hypothetical protein